MATGVGDVPNLVVEGETGFVVPPGDPDALAAALARLVGLPAAERRALGERGRVRVQERFALEEVAKRHVALYAALRHRCSGGRHS